MDDIRELEARFDARYQAVSARFMRVDNRFVGVDARLDEAERCNAILDRRATTRLEVVDATLTAAEVRIDHLRERLGRVAHDQDDARQRGDQLSRRVLAALVVNIGVSVTLWAGTVAFLVSCT